MTTEIPADIPQETGWDTAPGLLDGAKELILTPERCNLAYWLRGVAQGTLAGRAETGHSPQAATPEHMREPGPLREALIHELGLRSVSEERATRILGHYVANAPGIPQMEFFATQLLDETRHAMVFRRHLVELGIPEAELLTYIADLAADYRTRVLNPLEEWALPIVSNPKDFIGAVAIFTIVVEGVLAPAAELSERKWDLLDPAAGEIAHGAAIDEIRHLTVGSTIIRDALIEDPGYRPRLEQILEQGMQLWNEVPDKEIVMPREYLFQEGMQAHTDLLEEYEVWPGRRLLDTKPEERYAMAEQWTDEMAEVRMKYMGLGSAQQER
ncbi:VlmB-like protein [Streptomyces sp. NPDC001634]|uniref:VlmB-like protein n=1 Tax=Streptomyces sp. NPDC001634 TaxID=3154390 RepID=UPI00332951D9